MILLARIVVIVFAFLIACLASATTLMFAFLMLGQTDLARLAHLADDPETILVMIGLSTVTLSGYALLPSIPVVALAESFGLRSALFYALAGGTLAVVLTFGSVLGLNVSNIFAHDHGLMVGAGILAGLVYWTIAGRNSGAWRSTRGRA